MKKTRIYSGILLGVVLLFHACEKDPIMFDASMNFVGFSSASLTIPETGSGEIELFLGAPSGTSATTVSLSISAEGMDNPAVENTDFTIATKEVQVGVGETKVLVSAVDNGEFTGDKTFVIKISSNSKGYEIGAQNEVLVTITDDEHPLKNWIGTYSVDAASYGDPGNWDESWTVTTTAVPGDITKLQLIGIGDASADPLIAVLDVNTLKITIDPGQNIGDVYGYGEVEIYYGYGDLSLDTDKELEGAISADGNTITIDNFGELTKDPTGDWVWDVFNTTWTKQK